MTSMNLIGRRREKFESSMELGGKREPSRASPDEESNRDNFSSKPVYFFKKQPAHTAARPTCHKTAHPQRAEQSREAPPISLSSSSHHQPSHTLITSSHIRHANHHRAVASPSARQRGRQHVVTSTVSSSMHLCLRNMAAMRWRNLSWLIALRESFEINLHCKLKHCVSNCFCF